MKYIRTENGIFKVSKELKDGTYLIKGKYHIEKGVCPEADTIEELCDGFLLEPTMKGLTPVDYKRFTTAKKAKERIKLESTLYGAIWVKDKGLIYVAKMDNEGKLVLL